MEAVRRAVATFDTVTEELRTADDNDQGRFDLIAGRHA